MKGFGAIPATTQQIKAPRECTQWNNPDFPLALQGHCKYEWSYSTAFLDDVQAVRSCSKGGIELRYNDFRLCLGDFRPCEATNWCENPVYFKVSSTIERRYTITFFAERDENEESRLLPLIGKQIIFWSRQSESIIEIKNDSLIV